MSKLLLILGIALIIVSVPVLLIGILGTEDSPVGSILESMACKSPEKLVVVKNNYSMPNGEHGQTSNFYCEIEPGQRRNVTDTVVVAMIVAFLIPFGFGMLFTMVGSTRLARRRAKNFSADMAQYANLANFADTFQMGQGLDVQETVIDLRGKKGNISPQAQQVIDNFFGGVATTVKQTQDGNTLSGRLTQLEEAYENDLISKEEYDKVRQAILDSMDD